MAAVAAARARKATPGPALTRRGNHGDPRRQLVVSGHTAVSYAWSSQLGGAAGGHPGGVGADRLPGAAVGALAARLDVLGGLCRHPPPAVVADVVNFLTNDPVAGLSLGSERGLSANLQTREVVLREVTDPATHRAAGYETAMADRYGPAPLPPPAGHATVRALLLSASESVQDGSATARRAAGAFLTEASRALSR